MAQRFQFHGVEAKDSIMAEYSHGYHSSQTHHHEQPSFQDLLDPRLSQVTGTEPTKVYSQQGYYITPYLGPRLNQVSDEPIQRYLQQDYYTAPMPLLQNSPPHTVHHPQFTFVHSRSHGRGASPISQHHSSAASSAQSPQTESDLPYESTQGPSTPPDMTSPFLPHAQMSDTWDAQVDLKGINAYWPPDQNQSQTIDPAEILPSHVSLADCHDPDGINGFALDHSGCSQEDMSEAPFRLSSIESEIHVRSFSPVYPELESMDQDFGHSPQVAIKPSVKVEEKRAEFKPPMTRHRSDPSAGYQKSHNRQKRLERNTLTRPAKVLRVAGSQSGSSRMLPSTSSGGYYPCPECSDAVYKDDAALQKHIKTQHKRPFTCVFNFAGCTDAFANKNEWKRHVSAQHLNLQFWLCIHGTCGQTMNSDCDITGAATHGRPFRRKDLFTQHVRRMHIAASAPDTAKHRKKSTPEQDDQLKNMQDSAFRKRCEMPTYMRCPAQGCSSEFHGDKAWDDRMEHVARHLERAANNAEPPVEFGGVNDNTLTDWASSRTVRVICRGSNGWEQCQPLKSTKIDLQKVPGKVEDDAEGESC